MEPRTQELQRYVRFSKKDAERIAAFASRAAPHFQRIAQEFYERIREHEDAHKLFTGEEQIARLQRSMVAWLERLFGGVYDEAYFAKTENVGRVHVRIGLPQRYMPLAMSLIRSSLVQLLDRDETIERNVAVETSDAISRLLDIELTVMLESYQRVLVERVDRLSQLERDTAKWRATFLEEASVTAIEVAPLVVVGLDHEGSILLFNREAERLTGYAQDEVLGRGFVALFLPENMRDAERGRFENVVAVAPVREAARTLPMTLRSGKLRDIRWEIARGPDMSRRHNRAEHPQQQVATFLFGIDVTDLLFAHNQQDAERSFVALGTLAAGLAHEIRNPLNGARLHASFLERSLSQKTPASALARDEVLEAVRTVNTEIQRIAHLVTDVLDYAQPRPLAPSPASVSALCKRAIERTGATVGMPTISITSDLPANDSIIDVDVQRVDQALTNLIENAIESIATTPNKTGQIVVRSRREPKAVWIEVEDNGPGFSTDKPLFDAFFSTKATGTGLGLSIVHRIASDHGGTITAESKNGLTRFRLRLPLSTSEDPEQVTSSS